MQEKSISVCLAFGGHGLAPRDEGALGPLDALVFDLLRVLEVFVEQLGRVLVERVELRDEIEALQGRLALLEQAATDVSTSCASSANAGSGGGGADGAVSAAEFEALSEALIEAKMSAAQYAFERDEVNLSSTLT